MGRMGVGPDAGDEWIGLDQDRYMAQRGYFRANDGGYYSYGSVHEGPCTCSKPHVKPRKAKPPTKKQIAADKKAVRAFMKQIKEALYGPLYGERPKSRPSLKKKIRKASKRK